MFLKNKISVSTDNYSAKINKLRECIEAADSVVIGAGAGLSTSAGFVYHGERFENYFSDFEKKYGFHDMYSGGFYPFETLEEYWAYWSRYIYVNRYMDIPKPVYGRLLELIKDKDGAAKRHENPIRVNSPLSRLRQPHDCKSARRRHLCGG